MNSELTTKAAAVRRGTVHPKTLRALHAEWRKLSPGIQGSEQWQEVSGKQDAERAVRLEWANRQLPTRHSPLTTFNDLKPGEARFLLRRMREDSGDGPAYRARLIAGHALELWGSNWNQMLAARLGERFRVARPQDLTPREARAMIEELKSRIDRKTEKNGNRESGVGNREG